MEETNPQTQPPQLAPDIPWGKLDINPLGGHQPFDVITDVLIPVCILGMATAFAYFLIEVRGAWLRGGTEALRYMCFWFLMAVVLISRLRTKYGGDAVATPYQVALGGAILLFLFRFSGDVGSLAGGASSGMFLNCVIVAITWWGISKLTDECTVEDDTADESEEGLLSGLKTKPKASARSTNVQTTKDPTRDPHRRRRHPGRLVICFALGALLIFGLSQKVVAASGTESAARAFRWMVAYIFSSLFLLALTSLSGLRLYLKKRSVEMRGDLAPKWISASAMIVMSLLLMSAVMPRLAAEGKEWLNSRVPGSGSPSVQELPLRSPVEGFRAPRGTTNTDKNNGADNDRSGHGKQGQSQNPSQGSEGGDRVNKNREGKEAGEEGGKGTGQQKSGQGQGDSPSNDRDNSKQGQQQDSQEQHDSQSNGDSMRDRNTNGAAQNPDSTNHESGSEGNQHEPPQPRETNPLAELLSRIISILAIIAAIITAMVFLVRSVPSLGDFVRRVSRYHPTLAGITRRLHHKLDQLKALLAKWFSGGSQVAPRGVKPGKVTNPFRRSESLESLPAAEAVCLAYNRFADYAAIRGFPRKEQWTPLEFLRRLPESLQHLRDDATMLTHLYVVASYTPLQINDADVERLKAGWSHLRADADLFLSAQTNARTTPHPSTP